jgi:hypothetical protein
MDMENQKFMAFEGIQSWARALVRQVKRINSIQARFATREHFVDSRRQFACARHLFLIAAYKLIEYIDWAKNLEFLNEGLFVEIENFRKDIKDMRDLNEHAVEYFIGPGKFPHKPCAGRLDASRTTLLPNARRDLFEAMKQVAETGHGPANQTPSMGCSIKWKD